MQRHGQSRRRENLRELKTQERIGACRLGNTRRLDARTHTQLNPLKMNHSDLSQPLQPNLRIRAKAAILGGVEGQDVLCWIVPVP